MRVYTLAPQGDPELANVVDTVAFLNLSARLQREGADPDDHSSGWDVEQALANVTVRLYDREVDGSVRWPADAPWHSSMDLFVKDTVDPVLPARRLACFPSRANPPRFATCYLRSCRLWTSNGVFCR